MEKANPGADLIEQHHDRLPCIDGARHLQEDHRAALRLPDYSCAAL
jgi:hypothetical protein